MREDQYCIQCDNLIKDLAIMHSFISRNGLLEKYLSENPNSPQVIEEVVLARLSSRQREASGSIRNPPYGFNVGHNNRLEPNEQEQAIIARVRYLRESGYTTRRIASALNEEGFKTRRGNDWRNQYITRLLRNSASA